MRRQTATWTLVVTLLTLATPTVWSESQPPEVTISLRAAKTFLDLPALPLNWPKALKNKEVQLVFNVDLDLLAPLGSGQENAATYFAPFNRQNGSRFEQWNRARERFIKWSHHGIERDILPAGDPLLIEAEHWVDQANCRFYPDIIAYEGWDTTIPNLLHSLALGRSWLARGYAENNPADFRRCMRLGRLLLQDDVTVIHNLIGVALVRFGAEALYEHALADGDGVTTTLCALVIADANAIRMEYTRRLEDVPDLNDIKKTMFSYFFEISDDLVNRFVSEAKDSPAQALSIEVMTALFAIMSFATEPQQEVAREALLELRSSERPIVAVAAEYYLSGKPARQRLIELIEGSD